MKMPAVIHYRMFGYVATLVMHVTNLVAAANTTVSADAKKDPRLLAFKDLGPRFFTSWNFGLQMAYACLGLYCDVLTLINSHKKDYKLPKQLKGTRDIFFAAILWPCTWTVFTVFWSLYIYDRNLIFPEYLDQVVSTATNHVIHTAIVPVVLWEAVFRRRTIPKSHMRNILQLTLHMAIYLTVFYYTYYERGVWMYPIFKKYYGTKYFLHLHLCIGAVLVFYYYIQWALTYLIWGPNQEMKKVH